MVKAASEQPLPKMATTERRELKAVGRKGIYGSELLLGRNFQV